MKRFFLILLFFFISHFAVFAQSENSVMNAENWILESIQWNVQGGTVFSYGSLNESFFSQITNAEAVLGNRGITEFFPSQKRGTHAGLGISVRFNHKAYQQSEWNAGIFYQQIKAELGRYSLVQPPELLPEALVSYETTNQYVGITLGWDYVFRKGKRIEFTTGILTNTLIGTAASAKEFIWESVEASIQDSTFIERSYFAGNSWGFQLGVVLGMRLKLTQNSSFLLNWQSLKSRLHLDGSFFKPNQQHLQIGFIYRLKYE